MSEDQARRTSSRRVIVCGGRNYDDVTTVDRVLSEHIKPTDTVVDGQCPYGGADQLAHEWAVREGIATERFPANWKQEGRAAGPIRNQRMLWAGADLVIAFPGGNGTANMVALAEKADVPVIVASAAEQPFPDADEEQS